MVPNSYILINDGVNDSIAVDAEACEIKPTWNAAVCKGDVGRMNIGGRRRRRWFGGGRGAGAGPGGGRGAALAQLAVLALVAAVLAVLALAQRRSWRWRWRQRLGAGGPAQPPVVLSRNGKDYTVTEHNVRAGTEIKVTTERPSVSLTLTELDNGSWVIFELPGFTTAASGTQQNSLDALRKASDTSYYKDKDALWVKVVSTGDGAGTGAPGGGTSLQVSR